MHAHRTQRFFVCSAMAPKVPTAFCVCPDGNEYPVAAARAASTIVKSGSSTHGRGIRQVIFRNWFASVPKSPTTNT